MKDEDRTTHELLSIGKDRPQTGAPQLDVEKYREHVEDFDLTEEQQNELLETLWNILRTFVEIGFGLDSVQMFSTTENDSAAEKAGRDSGNALTGKSTPNHFNTAALDQAAKPREDT